MVLRCLAVVSLASACGAVEKPLTPDATPGDAPIGDAPEIPAAYRGMLDATQSVTFGGMFGQDNYCTYMITLKQLVIELGITPSGQVRTGRVQDLNFETTTADCEFDPIEPNVAMYTLASTAPGPGGMTLTFQGAPANNPTVDLVVELSTAGSVHQASLGFHRSDIDPPLDWAVVATVALSAQ